jgi:hypothetical protein
MTRHEGTTLLQPLIFLRETPVDKQCEWSGCSIPATYWIICPICSAKELQCDNHTLEVKRAPFGETLIFNCTCLHTVQQMDCAVEKI